MPSLVDRVWNYSKSVFSSGSVSSETKAGAGNKDPTDLESINNDPPPPYSEGETDAFDIIEKTLKSDDASKELREEVEKLGDSAADVERRFRNVAQCLQKALDAAATDEQIQQMKRFQVTWHKHHTQYVKLLWESRKVAGRAGATAKDFAGDFLDIVIGDMKYSREEKVKDIKIYLKDIEEERVNSANLSQAFAELHSAVGVFRTDIQPYVTAADGLEEMENIIKEVQEISEQLSKLLEADLLSAASALRLEDAGVGTVALGVICPSLLIRAAREASDDFKNRHDAENAERLARSKELIGKMEILENHHDSLKGLDKIRFILTPADNDIVVIQEKLHVFAQIWSFIQADLNGIIVDLERASKQKNQNYFERKIKTVSATYTVIARALRQYETNTHVEKIAEPESPPTAN